jgi:hypothetical protein
VRRGGGSKCDKTCGQVPYINNAAIDAKAQVHHGSTLDQVGCSPDTEDRTENGDHSQNPVLTHTQITVHLGVIIKDINIEVWKY